MAPKGTGWNRITSCARAMENPWVHSLPSPGIDGVEIGWSPATWLGFKQKSAARVSSVCKRDLCIMYIWISYNPIPKILDTPIPWSQLSGILNYGDSRRVVTALTLTYEVTTLGPQSWLGSWSNMHRKNCCFNSIGKARKLRDGPGKITYRTYQAARDPVDFRGHKRTRTLKFKSAISLVCYLVFTCQAPKQIEKWVQNVSYRCVLQIFQFYLFWIATGWLIR